MGEGCLVSIDGVNSTKDGGTAQYLSSTSHDGKTLLFDSGDWEKGFQIFAMDITGDNKRRLSRRK
jgi:Tol biopolymer transport system component